MKRRVLLIDDERLTHDNFARIFEKDQYYLDFATDSIEGLRKFKEKQYDVVLLDVIMPDLKNRQSRTAGLELLKVIRKLKPNLPVIMITCVDEAKTAIDTLKLGARDYILKDIITKKGLMQKIEEALMTEQYPIKKLISRGENSKLERTSSMRWNFRTNKIDKNIEMVWLKVIVAFLNSDGGTLLIGVQDDGSILGIEADNFPNEDKCLLHFSNLVRDYIGLEFSRFITNSFVLVDGKKVLKVECEKSRKPVFFKKNKKEEEFYIRVGPSSRILSMKEMLDYLENRKE